MTQEYAETADKAAQTASVGEHYSREVGPDVVEEPPLDDNAASEMVSSNLLLAGWQMHSGIARPDDEIDVSSSSEAPQPTFFHQQQQQPSSVCPWELLEPPSSPADSGNGSGRSSPTTVPSTPSTEEADGGPVAQRRNRLLAQLLHRKRTHNSRAELQTRRGTLYRSYTAFHLGNNGDVDVDRFVVHIGTLDGIRQKRTLLVLDDGPCGFVMSRLPPASARSCVGGIVALASIVPVDGRGFVNELQLLRFNERSESWSRICQLAAADIGFTTVMTKPAYSYEKKRKPSSFVSQ